MATEQASPIDDGGLESLPLDIRLSLNRVIHGTHTIHDASILAVYMLKLERIRLKLHRALYTLRATTSIIADKLGVLHLEDIEGWRESTDALRMSSGTKILGVTPVDEEDLE